MVTVLVPCTLYLHPMPNNYFQFKQFTIHQDRCAMKVTTDACFFGAWAVERVQSREYGVGSRESIVDSRKVKTARILDIGAGTGLLSIMLAQKSNATIDAIEIDKDASEQAGENINGSPWKDRISIYHADVTEFLFPSQYDVIISNPPFYENELKSVDAKRNIAHHEGLTLQQLLTVIKKNLSDDGKFFLLLPYKRKPEIEQLMRTSALSIIQQTFVRQSVKHDRFRIMIEGAIRQVDLKPIINEMSIWNDQQQYTPEFIVLLEDYYLNL
jgi:tRNA1Val (adenine37-N6)-methyltransferase